MSRSSTVSSPYSPDLAEVRAWLEHMVKAMRFAELVVAVVALVTRMRDLNAELVRQLAHLRRKRPRSETLERLERQLSLPLVVVVTPVLPKPKEEEPPGSKKSRKGRHPGRAAPPAHLERVVVRNDVPADMRVCPRCGSEMSTVGHSSCFTLNVIPARIVAKNTLRIPTGIPFEHAALTEALACVVRGLDECQPRSGDIIAIIGAGPIGLMFMHVAQLYGMRVIAVVKRDEQVAAARTFGASEVVQINDKTDPIAAVRALTPQRRGVDIAIEAVATPLAW